MTDEAITSEVRQRRKWRGIGLGAIAGLCLLAGIGYGLYWYSHARFHEKTDDAYVAGNIVAVTVARECHRHRPVGRAIPQTVQPGPVWSKWTRRGRKSA